LLAWKGFMVFYRLVFYNFSSGSYFRVYDGWSYPLLLEMDGVLEM